MKKEDGQDAQGQDEDNAWTEQGWMTKNKNIMISRFPSNFSMAMLTREQNAHCKAATLS